MKTVNATATVNETAIANNGTVVLAGGTATTANNYGHAIVGAGTTGYHFESWAATSGSPALGSTSQASTTVKVGAASTVTATGVANTYTVNYYNGSTLLGSSSHTYSFSRISLSLISSNFGEDIVS